jgi:protein gp37
MRDYFVGSKRYRDVHAPLEDRINEIAYAAGRLMEDGDNAHDCVLNLGWPLPNVWLGVSAERQQEADERIPLLLQTPAAVRFISAEPLLGPIDLNRIHEGFDTPEGARVEMWESSLNGKRFDLWAGDDEDPMQPGHPKLDWVIAGGESGPHARPANPQWYRELRDQCAGAGVPYFHKQNGEWVSVSEVEGPGRHFSFPDGRTVRRVGKKAAGRLLDGIEHNGFPKQGSI